MQPLVLRMGTAPLSKLVVRCYPGQSGRIGSFTFYEDDGISTGYARGKFAKTRLSYLANSSHITVTVAPAVGSYPGQVKSRSYVIELPCTLKASKAAVDGRPAKCKYDRVTCTNEVKVGPRSIARGCRVTLTAEPVKSDVLSVRAFTRRTGLNGGRSMKELVASALNRKNGASTLASAGMGLFETNESPYFYPARHSTSLYAPAELLGSKNVTWTVEEVGPTGSTVKVIETRHGVLTGSKTQAPAMEPKDLPSAAGDHFQLCARINARGQSVTLRFEPVAWNPLDRPENVARTAKVTASSVAWSNAQMGAVDGIVDGYPHAYTREWISNNEKTGAWIKLDWDTDQTVNRVWLFDRPNLDDHVTSGELTFSDGTSAPVGELANDASTGADIRFEQKKVQWMKFTITGVGPKTYSIGLSEIAVFEAR